MKEDYLWNKTGENAEIERLENTLKAFRYQETAPPALPAKIIPFEKKTSRGFFRLSFAFTAFATVLVICFGVLLQFSDKKSEVAATSPEIIVPQFEENSLKEPPAQKPTDSIIEKAETSKQFTEQEFIQTETPKRSSKHQIVKIQRNIPAVENQKNLSTQSRKIEKLDNLFAQNIEVKKPAIKLTKEEKYAYDQLMLALSITSSKLRLVTDKIENVEQQKAVREDER